MADTKISDLDAAAALDGTEEVAVVQDAATVKATAQDVADLADLSGLVADNDARLSDDRDPTAHAASHTDGGADEITVAEAQVTGLTAALAAKAPLASPTFTGNVVVPDADAATEAMNRQTSDARYPIGASEKGNLRFVIDGGGSTITTGAKKAYLSVPYAGTITAWTILGDASGAIVLDVWKDTYANFPPTVDDTITAAAKPTVTASATKATSSTLTGWTTSVAAGDVLEVNVDSVATFTKVTLDLAVTRTS